MWMDQFIDMYNATNYYINKNVYNFNNKQILKDKEKLINFRDLRDKHVKNKKTQLCKNKINKHLLDEAIKHNVFKHKTCITNYFSKNIKFFRLRNMKKTRRKKILIFEKGLFSKKKMDFVCQS